MSGKISKYALDEARTEARRLGASEGEAVRTIKIVTAYLDALLTEGLHHPSPPSGEGMTLVETVITDIREERKRQVKKGYDAAHDDGMRLGALAAMAIQHLGPVVAADPTIDAEIELIQAAALIVAELESILRDRERIRDGANF